MSLITRSTLLGLSTFFLAGSTALVNAADDNWGLPDPTKVVGAAVCGECHKLEHASWQQSTHYKIFAGFHRAPETKEISTAFGEKSVKRNDSCTKCHYTMQLPEGKTRAKAVSSISCESCHGAGKDWVDVHSDFGKFTKETEPAEHKAKRLTASTEAGMLNPKDLYAIAQNCFQCHTVPLEKLVNTTEHSAGSEFELVSWSQGELRHSFINSGEKNAPAAVENLHLMYLLGRSLDLEYGLRGLAKATSDDRFAKAMAARVKNARAELVKITEAGVDLAEIKAMLELIPSDDKFDFGNAERFIKLADGVRASARKMEANREANKAVIAKVAALIPTEFKGTVYE